MPRRRAVPERVTDLRRRLRDLPYGGRTRLAVVAGVPRGLVFAYTSEAEATRVPRPENLEALLSALNTLYPEVNSGMNETLFDNPDDAEFGAEVFEICDIAAHHHSEFNSVVDLDAQASDAVFAISRGEPLETVLGYVRDVNVRGEVEKHPAADEVRVALRELYGRTHGDTGATLSI